jgi:hypothetical protein
VELEMARYFSDLDSGITKYIDIVGTELADQEMVLREAIGFLTSFVKDTLPDETDKVFVVSVRNDVGERIFTTTLTLQSDWHTREIPASAAAMLVSCCDS